MDTHDANEHAGPRILAGRAGGFAHVRNLEQASAAAAGLARKLHSRLAASERDNAERLSSTAARIREDLRALGDNPLPALRSVAAEALAALEHNTASATDRATLYAAEADRASVLALDVLSLGGPPRVEGRRLLFGAGASEFVRGLTRWLWPLVDEAGDEADRAEFDRLHAERFDSVAKTAGLDASPLGAGDCVGPYSEDRSLVIEW